MSSLAVTDDQPSRLSEDLRLVLKAAGRRPMRIGEMVDILHGRGLQVVIILLCLPFLSPVSIPGVSVPFGLAIALCGLRIAFRKKPWLPDVILKRSIPYGALRKIVGAGCWFHGKLEKFTKPRLEILLSGPGMPQLIGAVIAVCGFYLSLPIPPPFLLTNTIPGVAIILLSLGLMERDGALVVGGYVFAVIATVYFACIAFLGQAGVTYLWRWISQLTGG